MDSDRAFQTIVSGSVLAKFGSFRTLGLYTLSRPKNPLVQITHSLDPENKAPLGSAEMSLGTDPKGAEYLRRPMKIGGGTTITNRCPSGHEDPKAELGSPCGSLAGSPRKLLVGEQERRWGLRYQAALYPHECPRS